MKKLSFHLTTVLIIVSVISVCLNLFILYQGKEMSNVKLLYYALSFLGCLYIFHRATTDKE